MKVKDLKHNHIYQLTINLDNHKEIYVFELNRVINNSYIVVDKNLCLSLTGEILSKDLKGGLIGLDKFFDKRTLKEVKDPKIIEMFNKKFK